MKVLRLHAVRETVDQADEHKTVERVAEEENAESVEFESGSYECAEVVSDKCVEVHECELDENIEAVQYVTAEIVEAWKAEVIGAEVDVRSKALAIVATPSKMDQ